MFIQWFFHRKLCFHLLVDFRCHSSYYVMYFECRFCHPAVSKCTGVHSILLFTSINQSFLWSVLSVQALAALSAFNSCTKHPIVFLSSNVIHPIQISLLAIKSLSHIEHSVTYCHILPYHSTSYSNRNCTFTDEVFLDSWWHEHIYLAVWFSIEIISVLAIC